MTYSVHLHFRRLLTLSENFCIMYLLMYGMPRNSKASTCSRLPAFYISNNNNNNNNNDDNEEHSQRLGIQNVLQLSKIIWCCMPWTTETKRGYWPLKHHTQVIGFLQLRSVPLVWECPMRPFVWPSVLDLARDYVSHTHVRVEHLWTLEVYMACFVDETDWSEWWPTRNELFV